MWSPYSSVLELRTILHLHKNYLLKTPLLLCYLPASGPKTIFQANRVTAFRTCTAASLPTYPATLWLQAPGDAHTPPAFTEELLGQLFSQPAIAPTSKTLSRANLTPTPSTTLPMTKPAFCLFASPDFQRLGVSSDLN